MAWPGHQEVATVELPTHRLSSLLKQAGVTPESVTLLVLDVQGAELTALKGAGEYLDHVACLEVEISSVEIYEGAPLFAALDTWLEERGIRCVSDQPRAAWHGDALYVRRFTARDIAMAKKG